MNNILENSKVIFVLEVISEKVKPNDFLFQKKNNIYTWLLFI